MSKSLAKTFLGLALAFAALPAFATDLVPEECVVNGDKFSEHENPPVKVSHEGKSITVCCRKCARKFKKNPDKYIKLYEAALEKEALARKK